MQIALFTGVGLFAGPIAAIAIKGLLGLIACGVIGLAAVTFGPVIADKAANWRLKMLKAEAAKNPVETLQLQLIERRTALEENLESIGKLRANNMDFADKVQVFKRDFPEEATQFEAQLESMNELLREHEQKYTEATTATDQFEKEIRRADAIWKMTLAAADAAHGAKLTIEDFTAKIKKETALDAIQSGMNRSFSELATIRLRNRQTRQTTNDLKLTQ
jgi:hypothetical protein